MPFLKTIFDIALHYVVTMFILLCFSLSFSLGSDVMPSLYSLLCACLLLVSLPLVTTSTQRNRCRNRNHWQCFDHSSPGGYLGALGHVIEKKSFEQCTETLERPVLEKESQEFQRVENRNVRIIFVTLQVLHP